jgi:hypothetical protein
MGTQLQIASYTLSSVIAVEVIRSIAGFEQARFIIISKPDKTIAYFNNDLRPEQEQAILDRFTQLALRLTVPN